MKIKNIIQQLELFAHPSLQEHYDNSGLIIGNSDCICTGIVCTLDATEEVVKEAINKGCNLIVAHHPIIFSGLKKINGNNYVEKTIITAIKNDIAIYAIHTNLDNVIEGVNNTIAQKIGLINCSILQPKNGLLTKLYTYIPATHTNQVRDAIFEVGAGVIANYSENSFLVKGIGTFKGNKKSVPFIGEVDIRKEVEEDKLEIIFPTWLTNKVVDALKKTHPYEEVAYELIPLSNQLQTTGSGLIGSLPQPMQALQVFKLLQKTFNLDVIKHTHMVNKPIQKIAVCGGAGSFLIKNAIAASADMFITADIKYHEFFDAEQQLVIADIGHWESEQFTIDLMMAFLQQKFPTFAVLKSNVNTNPVQYFF